MIKKYMGCVFVLGGLGIMLWTLWDTSPRMFVALWLFVLGGVWIGAWGGKKRGT